MKKAVQQVVRGPDKLIIAVVQQLGWHLHVSEARRDWPDGGQPFYSRILEGRDDGSKD